MAESEAVHVRPRTDGDLSELGAALVEVHARDGYPVEGVSDPVGWLNAPGFVRSWTAEADGVLVGQVSLARPVGEDAVRLWQERSEQNAEDVLVLARLFVRPKARGSGTGKALTLAAMEYARQRGLTLVLDVMAKDRAAIRLYEKLGWEPIGTADHTVEGAESVPALCYAWDSSAASASST